VVAYHGSTLWMGYVFYLMLDMMYLELVLYYEDLMHGMPSFLLNPTDVPMNTIAGVLLLFQC
jgi:hypothetical protein